MRLKSTLNTKAHLIALSGDLTAVDSGGRPPSECSPEQLAKINAMPMVRYPLSADRLFVRGVWAINDQTLFNGLRIDTAEIARIAELAIGASQLANHDTYNGRQALPFGRIFDSAVAKDDAGATWAQLWSWIPEIDFTRDLVIQIDGGAVAENSVSIGYERLECTICGENVQNDWQHDHDPGATYNGKLCEWLIKGVETFYENSYVWAGMAIGTHFMAAARDGEAIDVAEAMKGRAAARRAPKDSLEALLSDAQWAGGDLEMLFEKESAPSAHPLAQFFSDDPQGLDEELEFMERLLK